ncbi:MAG TPA: DUF983 domain-containing protein [Candidatus Acidoferrales bacterium]|nr:DUF983 domain-containing protein [Candidatus Acidoferrales bacterium]
MPTRRPFSEALLTGIRCRCPNCGVGPLFMGWLRMPPACPRCKLSYCPESGYYVGAMYLNFIFSALTVAILYAVTLPVHFLARGSIAGELVFWISLGILLSLLLMRHSYSLWISVDFWLTPWEPGVEYPLG